MGYTSDARLAAYIATIIEVNNGIAALNATGQIYSYRAPMACGVIAITPVANVATSGAVTFPASRFRTAANIVVTGQLLVLDLKSEGVQDCSPECWADLSEELVPLGFSYADGKLRIPGDLCPWWVALLAGATDEELAALWPSDG